MFRKEKSVWEQGESGSVTTYVLALQFTDIFWAITVQHVKIRISFSVLYWEVPKHTPVKEKAIRLPALQ